MIALRERLGAQNVIYTPGCPIVPGVYTDFDIVSSENLFHSENGKLVQGLKAEYFTNAKWEGEPKLIRIDPKIDFYWVRSPVNNLIEEEFSVRWTGVLIPKKSGTYRFGGNVRLRIDKKQVSGAGITLEKGKKYEIMAELRVASNPYNNSLEPSASLSWIDISRDFRQEALDAARKADVVIFCGGITANLEGEEMPLEIDGFSHGDRTHINLPGVQEDLLKELHKTGKPIVYVNFSGSAMALNWEDENLPAIVQAFYPGETTGTALTRLLFGDFNASGRLPVTFYKSERDIPAFSNYDMQGRTYRYFHGTPLYPFGYGLSYTSFEYSNLVVDKTSDTQSPVELSIDIKNTGKRDGEEVVQVYVSNKTATTIVPITSLKGFKRVYLKQGEKKTVTFTLKPEDFSVTTADAIQVVAPGVFDIAVGGAIPDINTEVRSIEITGNAFEIE